MKKIRVWRESNDACNVDGQETIEVSDDATEDEIEEAVRETALEHFEYGYEEVQDD